MRMLNAMPQPHPLSSLCPRSVHDLGWAGEWALSDSAGGISLFVGKPGPECGHMVDASSYFDRWVRRNVTTLLLIIAKILKLLQKYCQLMPSSFCLFLRL